MTSTIVKKSNKFTQLFQSKLIAICNIIATNVGWVEQSETQHYNNFRF
ncbi:hypothetical protein FDUTEX481_05779 [Tolypothrix sp. PCC 7601]|nr:hypothetical protein FDUTEX481_05779 [Tolypothrix sp. PCC 7601]